jgi:hypothetical protein
MKAPQLKNWLKLAKDWVKDKKLGDKCEEIVYNELQNDGYTVKIIPDVDLGTGLSKEQRIQLAQEEKFKPDAFITINNKTTFIDVKGKTKETSLGMVNVRDYHKYWRGITELNAKMRIYFYIAETQEIWFHDLRDPQLKPHFPTRDFSDGQVYVIPKTELTFYKKLA